MTFTIPKPVLALLAAFLLGFAGDCTSNSDTVNHESSQVATQQDIYNQHQPPPLYQYSAERAALVQILNQRTSGTLNTWTVWFSNNGVPLGMCASRGYPIPYSTELTNPTQAVSPGSTSGYATVDQMDPQGTYPSQNTLATWVLCIDPASGSIHAQYVEPLVITYTYPVEIRGGQVVQTGPPRSDSALTLGR